MSDKRTRLKRSDAVRNREVILDAALELLAENGQASMAEIAEAAGMGRVTLYGHFSSRKALVEAVFTRAVSRANSALKALNLPDEPLEALKQLVSSSWAIVGEMHQLLGAAEHELGHTKVRDINKDALEVVDKLIAKGQAEGVFRSDLPRGWLIASFYAILHQGAAEIRDGRMTNAVADTAVPATAISLLHRHNQI